MWHERRLSICNSRKKREGRRIKMGFQDEMKQIFLRVAAGEIEPVEWETWWNSNRLKPRGVR